MKQLFLILFCFIFITSLAQDLNTHTYQNNGLDIDLQSTVDKKKRNILLISEAAIYSGALVTLNQLWYSDYPRSSFHFINDNAEWLQMDKLGHMTVSYYWGVAGIKAYEWAGMKKKNAIWYGGLTGTFFLTAIEVLDGQSAEWGASSGDLLANTTGSLLAIAQALKWNEQRIQLKYSYSPSEWANVNPQQLGENYLQRTLKDYNGQTYWLSFNLKSLFDIQITNFPHWLNVAVGHGANGMVSAYQKENDSKRIRQFMLSLDVDLTRVKTKSKILNTFLHSIAFIKFPLPTLEFTNGKLQAHPIYF
tara:strand:+ start:124 stop:1038 length:915 start_codon:yes stop_codon:yes gene_type:complete